jgi:hypothetical protein
MRVGNSSDDAQGRCPSIYGAINGLFFGHGATCHFIEDILANWGTIDQRTGSACDSSGVRH